MGLLTRMLGVPTIGKIIVKLMRKQGFKSFQIPMGKALEKQNIRLRKKFRKMENTEIGKKLGIGSGTQLKDLPLTDYNFYSSFFNNPKPSDFMYPLSEYARVRTSGTSGAEKWFMIPKQVFPKMFRETGIPLLMSLFHDGEKITFEYGDSLYVNMAPRPFIGGLNISMTNAGYGIINIAPHINLSYHEKTQFFITNHKNIDGAVMLASTLVSQIIPAIGKPINLKGLLVFDSVIGEIYKKEIEEFIGVPPRASYGSTEIGFAAGIASIQYPLSFVLDWRRGFFEFFPVKKGVVEKEEPMGLNNVKTGEIYEMVYTSFDSELTRYRTKDSLVCVAKGDDIIGTDYPVFKFHSRLEKTISLLSFTRISEEELLTALKETGIPFIEFTCRVEVEEGLEYMVMYIECTGDIPAHQIQKQVNTYLYENDGDYRDLVNFFKYEPLKIQLVPKGVFSKYLEEKIAGVAKVQRVNMAEEEFKKIIKLRKTL